MSPRRRRIAPTLLLALTAGAAAAVPGAATERSGVDWPAVCEALTALPDEAARRVAARDCALALERALGPDDARLVALYADIAERLAGGRGGASARAALPYRRRAHRAAERLLGRRSEGAGRAALDYARASILAGRCEAHDPMAIGLLEAAAEGMRAAEGAARLEGLRAVAAGFADGLAYERAVETLLEAGGPERAALRAEDWERLGVWRHRLGDARGASEAYRAALARDPGPRDRLRLRQSLKQTLFESGDLEAIRALEAEEAVRR